MIKYFCDRCEVEAKQLEEVVIETPTVKHTVHVCPKCADLLKEYKAEYLTNMAWLEEQYLTKALTNIGRESIDEPTNEVEDNDEPTIEPTPTVKKVRSIINPKINLEGTHTDKWTHTRKDDPLKYAELPYILFASKAVMKKDLLNHFEMSAYEFDKMIKKYRDYYGLPEVGKGKHLKKTPAYIAIEKILKLVCQNKNDYTWAKVTATDIKEAYPEFLKDCSNRAIIEALHLIGFRKYKGKADTRDYPGAYFYKFPYKPTSNEKINIFEMEF